MELNFDKEINALLRQAARSGETVPANAPNHLDADEISAFAENALPEKTRAVYTKHLADCDRCRTILSNVILLNSEKETELSVVTAAPEIVETRTPWYRKLFAMPNLAYTMGALALLFGGFLGFFVLQNINNSQKTEVSQIYDNEQKASGPNIGSGEVFYNSNAMSLNTANVSTNSAANPPISVSNSAMSNANLAVSATNTATPAATPELLAKEKRKEQEQSSEDEEKIIAQPNAAPLKTENDAIVDQTSPQERESAKSSSPKPVQAAPPVSMTGRGVVKDKAGSKKSSEKDGKKDSADETARQIGGKSFNRKNGVWYDTAYRGQRTTNVRRGTENYLKLDGGLRVIAESLDGTVVVVWKEKAYRIE